MEAEKLLGRSTKGAITIPFTLIVTLIILVPLGILGYEFARGFLVQEQLHHVCDSAALSGSAAMASAPANLPYAQRQKDAMATAFQTFQMNSILQTPLNQGNVSVNYNPSAPSAANPPLHQAVINLILLDQNGNAVATGTPAASMKVQAYWTEAPIWGMTGSIQSRYTVTSFSNGGLPQLDIMVCMDVSGSMDDQTPVRFVNRYWDTSKGAGRLNWNRQVESKGNSGYPTASTPTLYDVLHLTSVGTYTGTALNVYPPENLSFASYHGTDANGVSFLWSETPDAKSYQYSKLRGLRSNAQVTGFSSATMPEAGRPPGNCNPALPNTSTMPPDGKPAHKIDPHLQDAQGGFTDLIADMGWNKLGTSGGTTFNGFVFNNAETAVEAARGNMESLSVLESACGYPGNRAKIPASLPAPSSGYFSAYWSWVLEHASPMAEGRQALYNFYNTMNVSSNCHLGLITFSTGIGLGPNSVFADTNQNIDKSYTLGGSGTFPNPACAIKATDSQETEYDAVVTAVEGSTAPPPPTWSSTAFPLRSEGATDIADALSAALGVLTNGKAGANVLSGSPRSAAKKAIVLFTDGVPNIPGGFEPARIAALHQAGVAGGNSANIPIYTIGLATNPALTTMENDLLSPPRGIAGLSGKSAIYVPIAKANQLDTAFQTIARSLCELQF